MHFRIPLLLILFSLGGCIGTDYFDDPVVEPILIISSEQTSVFKGKRIEIDTLYTNEFALVASVPIVWNSSDEMVATVIGGIVEGVSSGQTMISASYNQTVSNFIQITVVEGLSEIATVEVSLPDNITTQMSEGQTIQLSAVALNIEETEVESGDFTWSSSNTNVATIDATGLLTAITNGTTNITATADEVASEALLFTIGVQSRNGSFEGVGSYNASGNVALVVDTSGDLLVILSDDFEADIALGTFIYLSNTTTGPSTSVDGLELGEVSGNGGITFNASSLKRDVALSDYQYVIVLCKPASITFGFAELD